MFRKVIENSIKTYFITIRKSSATVTQTARNDKWDICAGVLVERLPVLTKQLTDLEAKYQSFLMQVEFENSLKSDFELQHEREVIVAEKIKKGQMEIDLDDTSKQTAQDLKDAYTEELKAFKLAPRITDADQKKDLQSTNRDLENTLYLLVEQQLGDKTHLILPQGKHQQGETMRQTAERVLRERCGDNINVIFYGNAPCGFFKYKYPASQRSEAVGAKIFFFRSALKKGSVDKKSAKNFVWLDRNELEKKLNGGYSESVQEFLI